MNKNTKIDKSYEFIDIIILLLFAMMVIIKIVCLYNIFCKKFELENQITNPNAYGNFN